MIVRRSLTLCALFLLASCDEKDPPRNLATASDANAAAAAATNAPPPMRYAEGVQTVQPPAKERKAKFAELVPKLDELFAKNVTEHHYSGIGVGIVLDGETVYAKGFGLRNREANTPFQADSLFRIASCTKSFTAMAILKLRDEGKLSLDEPAARYYAPLEKLAYPTHDSTPVTVRQLLTHGSGLPEDNAWLDAAKERTAAELLQLVESGMTFSRAPNSSFEYSNTGYAILGQIVAQVAKMPLREYVSKQILTPLGMRGSFWDRSEFPSERLVIGYRGQDGLLGKDASANAAPIENGGVMDAAGGLYTSINDMSRYVAFHLSAWPPRSAEESGPVHRSSLREMQLGERPASFADMPPALFPSQPPRFYQTQGNEPQLYVFSYGYGLWSARTCDDEFRVEHLGGLPGYVTTVQMYPQRGYGIVVFVNDERVHNSAADEATKLLRQAGVIDVLPQPAVPALDAAAEEIASLYSNFDAARAQRLFDPTFWNYQTVEKFQGRLTDLAKAHGACKRDGAVKVRNLTRGVFRMSCERGEINFVPVLSPEAKPRLQVLLWDESLPPSADLLNSGNAIAGLITRFDEAALKKRLAPTADLKSTRKKLLRLGIDFGACKLDKPLVSDGINSAKFLYACGDGQVEMSLVIDEKTHLIKALSGAAKNNSAFCAP